MAKSKATLENEIRTNFITAISDFITKTFETDVLPISASELTIPVTDSENNEKFVNIKISIPRGTRNGSGYDPYDGYAAAEDYKAELADKKAKQDAKQKKERG